MSGLIVYSCVTGGKDRIREDMLPAKGVRYVMFTDSATESDCYKGWEIHPLSPLMFPGLDPARQAMWHRWHPHKLFPEGSLTLWLDANQRTKVDPAAYFERFNGDPLFIRHPYRVDVYQEAEEHLRLGIDDPNRIRSQMNYYRTSGYAAGQGLVMTGFIGRRVPRASDRAMVGFFEETFAHVRRWSYRDQLCVPFTAWQFGVPLAMLPSMTEASLFEDEPHLR